MLQIFRNTLVVTILTLQFSCDNNPSFNNCIEDNCGNCNNDPSDDCSQDCNDDWGGNAIIDCAGVCGGSSLTDCSGLCITPNVNNQYNGDFAAMDCNGICDGDAIIDECGTCEGPGSVFQCGCSGYPQQASGGNAEKANFTILESHNFPIEQNQIIRGVSFNNTTITESCGVLTILDINGRIDDVQNIIFNMPLGNYQLAHQFNYYNKDCEEDVIDENIACSSNFPDNTIFINKYDQVIYKSTIDISSFSFMLIGASIPRSCDCEGNSLDCSDVCGGNDYNANGCCDNEIPDCLNDCDGNNVEIPYDTDNSDEIYNDGLCECLQSLNSDECCCNETRDCEGICGGNATIDECQICNGDNLTCAGCDGVPNSGLGIDCLGECGGDEIDDDNDGICDYEDSCIGSAEECGETIDSGCDLPINHIFLDNNSNVWYNLNFINKGFQWTIEGATGLSATGGDAETNGFTVSASGSTVLGFSFTGSSIQAGCGTLTILSLDGNATSFNNIIFTDSSDNGVDFVEYYNP